MLSPFCLHVAFVNLIGCKISGNHINLGFAVGSGQPGGGLRHSLIKRLHMGARDSSFCR